MSVYSRWPHVGAKGTALQRLPEYAEDVVAVPTHRSTVGPIPIEIRRWPYSVIHRPLAPMNGHMRPI